MSATETKKKYFEFEIIKVRYSYQTQRNSICCNQIIRRVRSFLKNKVLMLQHRPDTKNGHIKQPLARCCSSFGLRRGIITQKSNNISFIMAKALDHNHKHIHRMTHYWCLPQFQLIMTCNLT